ncbi:hypothetical protein C8R47DRAFT_1070739 [Mycena vitilis]|nr:hypothetical protein C8R47DRAFT_1070739 [Mycena vitilis]
MIVPHGTIDRTGNETAAVSARAGGLVCEGVERFEARDEVLATGCVVGFEVKAGKLQHKGSSRRRRPKRTRRERVQQSGGSSLRGELTQSELEPVTQAKGPVTLDRAPVTWRDYNMHKQ